MLVAASFAPPPHVPPLEKAMAKTVLAYSSLAAGSVMLFGFIVCACLFCAPQLLGVLHRLSNGRFGKPQRSLLPGSVQ